MAILRDREIEELVSQGRLIASHYAEDNLTPNGYDLTISGIRVDGEDGETEEANVPPGRVFWVSTAEVVDMPANVGGQIWIRSSYARKGVFGSFGFVDAGFRGSLTLAFLNGSASELRISAGMTIAQLTFVKLDGEAESTYEKRSGNYQNQTGIRL